MPRMSYRCLTRTLTLGALAVTVGCSATTGGVPPVYRGVTIVDNQFYPATLTAPAGIPVILELTRLNPGELDVAIPSLGLPHISVPGNLIIQNSTKSAPGIFARARQELGSLAPGDYAIECLCAEHSVTKLIITASAKERAD